MQLVLQQQQQGLQCCMIGLLLGLVACSHVTLM